MIDIKELRIGCHVMVDGTRQTVLMVDGGMHDYDVEPIPITEELLKELGFDVHDLPYRIIGCHNVWCVQQNSYDFEKDRVVRLNVWDLTISKSIRIVASEIRYLHQLENFVYMVTGTELIDD